MKPNLEKLKIHAAEARSLRDDPAFQRAVLEHQAALLPEPGQRPSAQHQQLRTTQALIRAIDLMAEMIADEIMRGTEPRQIGLSVA